MSPLAREGRRGFLKRPRLAKNRELRLLQLITKPYASRLSEKNMIYGIYVTKENFDIFEDGSEKRTSISQGWYQDAYYNSMKSAKNSLAMAKDTLNEDFYAVTEVNSVTIKGVRDSNYGGERFAPTKLEERVVYHIEKR